MCANHVWATNDVYEGNWLDDVIAGGGGESYSVVPQL